MVGCVVCEQVAATKVFGWSFDFRSQGESDFQPGYAPLHWPTTLELEDVRAALRFIQSRDDLRALPLGVMGVSRGATPALIAAAESSRVKAVCCEGAYSTDALMVHFISRWATLYVPRFLLPVLPMWHIRMTSKLVRWTSQFLRNRRYVVLERWLPRLKNRSVLLVAGTAATMFIRCRGRDPPSGCSRRRILTTTSPSA